jgi:hypothetical protein
MTLGDAAEAQQSSPVTHSDEVMGEAGPSICWTVHPLVDEPRYRSALLAGMIIGLAAAVTFSFQSVALGAVTLVVLLGAMSRYWAPTVLELSPGGVRAAHLGRSRLRPWTDFRRLAVGADGLFLGPNPAPSRVDAFRGAFLRCRGAELAAARAVAERHVKMG